MGTRIIAGRDVTWSDIETGGRVAVDLRGASLASSRATPAGALGKRIRPPVDSDAWREVIGVVQSVQEDALYEEPPSLVYWPALMENMFGSAAVRRSPTVAFVDPQRPRGHRESHRRDPASDLVGERETCRSRSSARCRISTPARSRARRSRS